jgi:hypothetical protein
MPLALGTEEIREVFKFYSELESLTAIVILNGNQCLRRREGNTIQRRNGSYGEDI